MGIAPKQIGWSQESNLLWEISRTLDYIYGNVGGLQGAITLTTTGNSGPATLISNILNVPEYTIDGLGGVPTTRTITINGNTQTLAADVAFTVLGSPISVVPNYSALPAPNTVSGSFYWAEESQGTYWLPGGLGGTFYNAGMYYSNGVEWQFMETPWQAVQAEVDAGVNFTKFVTPLTFDSAAKWNTKQNNLILTTTGSSGAATLIGDTLNIPIYGGGSGGGGGTAIVQMLTGINSATAPFEKLIKLEDFVAGPLATTTTSVNTTPTLLQSFITEPGLPGLSKIDIGTAFCVFQTQKAAGSNNYYCYFTVSKYSALNVETLLLTSGNTSQVSTNTVIQQTAFIYNNSVVPLDPTDRLVVKIYAVMVSASANITLSYDANTNARFQASIPTDETYVPKTTVLNINGVDQDLSTNREWRTALADTGVLTYGGISIASSTTVNVGACKGLIVDNETDPLNPVFTYVDYAGQSGVTVPTIGTGVGTYVLLKMVGDVPTLHFQNTFPTSADRKQMIYLSKVAHPNLTAITFALNETDFITSPLAQFRDVFQALNYINEGVVPFAGAANLTFATTAGKIWGNGINFVADRTNPNALSLAALNPVSFLIRNQNGGTGGFVTLLDPTTWDNAGVTTVVGGGVNRSTNQYVFYAPGAGFAVQRGQFIYNDLQDAIAAVGKESFVVFQNLRKDAILLGIWSVKHTCTNLQNTADAQFIRASKIGEVTSGGGGGGGGTTGYSVTTVSTNTTLTPTSGENIIKVDTTAGNVTVTLPTAVGNTAKFVIKKTAGANNVIVAAFAGQNIDGGATATIIVSQAAFNLYSDNTNWLIT